MAKPDFSVYFRLIAKTRPNYSSPFPSCHKKGEDRTGSGQQTQGFVQIALSGGDVDWWPSGKNNRTPPDTIMPPRRTPGNNKSRPRRPIFKSFCQRHVWLLKLPPSTFFRNFGERRERGSGDLLCPRRSCIQGGQVTSERDANGFQNSSSILM